MTQCHPGHPHHDAPRRHHIVVCMVWQLDKPSHPHKSFNSHEQRVRQALRLVDQSRLDTVVVLNTLGSLTTSLFPVHSEGAD
jgi:hypothetical protein